MSVHPRYHDYSLTLKVTKELRKLCPTVIQNNYISEWLQTYQNEESIWHVPEYYRQLISRVFHKHIKASYAICAYPPNLNGTTKPRFLNDRYQIALKSSYSFNYACDCLVFFDLFHRQQREMPIIKGKLVLKHNSTVIFRLIDSEYLLLLEIGIDFNGVHSALIRLIKLDFNDWTCKIVSLHFYVSRHLISVVFDSKNTHKFLLQFHNSDRHDRNDQITRGTIKNDQIMFNNLIEEVSTSNGLCCYKMENEIVSAIRMSKVQRTHFYYLSQSDLNEPSLGFDVKFRFKKENLISFDMIDLDSYTWSGNVCYVNVKDKHEQKFTICAFNADTTECSKVNLFGIDHFLSMIFASSDHVLVMNTLQKEDKYSCIYRHSLRTPDSMLNLAWFTIRRQDLFHDNTCLYEYALKILPLNSELQPFNF